MKYFSLLHHSPRGVATTFGILIRKIRELRANAHLTPEQFAAMKLAGFRHLVFQPPHLEAGV